MLGSVCLVDPKDVAARLLAPTGLLKPVEGDVTRLDQLRRKAAARAARAATGLHDYLSYVGLEHLPPRVAEPRWGHGKPLHAGLLEIISAGRPSYEAFVASLVELSEDLAAIPVQQIGDVEPCWRNPWLPALDTAALYGFLRTRQPGRYVEVGSGFSTRVAARAVRDGGLATTLTSIDPSPRAVIDELCDVVVRSPMEDVPLSFWQELSPGDMVFVDNSHRALMHSDATVFFLEVLPNLPSGVLVGIHDVLLPADYHPAWGDYLFSEQYLLAAYLLAGASWLRPAFASYWASELSDVTAPLAPLFDGLAEPRLNRRGWSFWLDVDRER